MFVALFISLWQARFKGYARVIIVVPDLHMAYSLVVPTKDMFGNNKMLRYEVTPPLNLNS